jgi:hypothetical protein
VVRIQRVDLSGLTSEDLATLYKRCVLVHATNGLKAVAREGLRRDDFDTLLPRAKLYEQLFSLEEDSDAAIAVLDEARDWAESRGESTGPWDLVELQLHIAENNSEGANRTLAHLRDEHMNEPEIAQQIYQLLYMIGAIPADAPMQAPSRIPPAAVGAAAGAHSESGIWTPGGETATAGKGKLWTPD